MGIKKEKIRIFHTNDIHSNFEFLGRVYNYLLENKKEDDLYLDSGDYLDLKSLVVQGDKGKMAMELFFNTKLDAMTIGNNEIDLGYDALQYLIKSFNIVSTNLRDKHGNKIPGLKNSMILTKKGIRFLILGLAPYFDVVFKEGAYNNFYMLNNFSTINPYPAMEEEIKNNEGKYDVIILLSHSGHFVDEIILKKFPNINLVLGGHTHRVESKNRYSQSGMGEYLGDITINITHNYNEHKKENEILKPQQNITIEVNKQINVSENSINNSFIYSIENLKEKANKLLEVEIESIDSLEFKPYCENRLINFICDALMKEFKGDLAIMHNGIALGTIVKPISKKSLIEALPSKLNPTFYKIKGKEIKKAIIESFNKDHIKQNGRGPGFRGTVLGTLGFSSNVSINKESLEIKVDDHLLKDEKEYLLLTDDYLQRGTGYTSLRVSDEYASYHKWFIRDLVENYLMDEEVYRKSLIKRIN